MAIFNSYVSHYQRVLSTIKSHETTIFPWLPYGLPAIDFLVPSISLTSTLSPSASPRRSRRLFRGSGRSWPGGTDTCGDLLLKFPCFNNIHKHMYLYKQHIQYTTYMQKYVHVYVCMIYQIKCKLHYVYTYMYIYIYVCVCVIKNICTYIHTYRQTDRQTYIHRF